MCDGVLIMLGMFHFLHVNKMHDALNEAPLKNTNNVAASRNSSYCANWHPFIHPIEITQSMCQLLKTISKNEFLKLSFVLTLPDKRMRIHVRNLAKDSGRPPINNYVNRPQKFSGFY